MLTIRSKLITFLWLLITALVLATGYWNYYNIRAQLIPLVNNETAHPGLALLIDNIALAQIVPMVCLWLILLFLTRFCVNWILKPLEKISSAVSLRNPDYLSPISDQEVPLEIKPMVAQINHVFSRLAEAIAREKRFTADASHELRTPLAAIRVQAEVALAITDEMARRQTLEKIIIGVDRCTHIIQQLATLAKLKPHESISDIHEVNLSLLVYEVAAELTDIASAKNIEIELDVDAAATVLGNFAALRILMRNIIDNAIRYSEENQNIDIQIKRTPEKVLFRVEDHGPGIPAEMHERVFERFFRGMGHAATGSGLGLAIVDQIVTLHHATVQLGKRKDGKPGLCFDVIFPLPPTP